MKEKQQWHRARRLISNENGILTIEFRDDSIRVLDLKTLLDGTGKHDAPMRDGIPGVYVESGILTWPDGFWSKDELGTKTLYHYDIDPKTVWEASVPQSAGGHNG